MPSTPPSSSLTDRQACEAALDRITAMVAIAQGLASGGRTVSLTGLDAAAGRVCAQILDLPPREGAAFRPALRALERKLGLLTDILRHPR